MGEPDADCLVGQRRSLRYLILFVTYALTAFLVLRFLYPIVSSLLRARRDSKLRCHEGTRNLCLTLSCHSCRFHRIPLRIPTTSPRILQMPHLSIQYHSVCIVCWEVISVFLIASSVSNAECGVKDVAVKAVKQATCWPTVLQWPKTHGARSIHARMGLVELVAQ